MSTPHGSLRMAEDSTHRELRDLPCFLIWLPISVSSSIYPVCRTTCSHLTSVFPNQHFLASPSLSVTHYSSHPQWRIQSWSTDTWTTFLTAPSSAQHPTRHSSNITYCNNTYWMGSLNAQTVQNCIHCFSAGSVSLTLPRPFQTPFWFWAGLLD
jgi:hypothetical protein